MDKQKAWMYNEIEKQIFQKKLECVKLDDFKQRCLDKDVPVYQVVTYKRESGWKHYKMCQSKAMALNLAKSQEKAEVREVRPELLEMDEIMDIVYDDFVNTCT